MTRPDRRRGENARVPAALALVALVAAWAGPAQAICASSVDRNYLDDVIDDPKSLLRLNPRGGAPLVLSIRQLAVNGTRVLKLIGTLIPQANPQQKDAIGRGLAYANGACSARSPEIARQVSDVVRTSSDRDVIRAYNRFFSTTEDTPVQSNTTSTRDSQEEAGRRTLNLDPGSSPRSLPLGNPFAKP